MLDPVGGGFWFCHAARGRRDADAGGGGGFGSAQMDELPSLLLCGMCARAEQCLVRWCRQIVMEENLICASWWWVSDA